MKGRWSEEAQLASFTTLFTNICDNDGNIKFGLGWGGAAGRAATKQIITVPEFIDRENKPKTLVSVIQNERFGLVFANNGSIISGTGVPGYSAAK